MDVKKLSDEVSVGGQIGVHDVAEVHALGFRSIVCNRPDGEAPDQELWEAIETEARRKGMGTAYIPVSNQTGLTREAVADFAEALRTLPKPIFAYCRSGARSAHLNDAAASQEG